jgi:hypothetical protein
MLLNSEKVFVASMLMIGAAHAQVVDNVTRQAPPGLAITDLQITPQRTLTKGGHVIIPESSTPKPGDAGQRAHTNIRVFLPSEATEPGTPAPSSPSD